MILHEDESRWFCSRSHGLRMAGRRFLPAVDYRSRHGGSSATWYPAPFLSCSLYWPVASRVTGRSRMAAGAPAIEMTFHQRKEEGGRPNRAHLPNGVNVFQAAYVNVAHNASIYMSLAEA